MLTRAPAVLCGASLLCWNWRSGNKRAIERNTASLSGQSSEPGACSTSIQAATGSAISAELAWAGGVDSKVAHNKEPKHCPALRRTAGTIARKVSNQTKALTVVDAGRSLMVEKIFLRPNFGDFSDRARAWPAYMVC